MNSDTKIKKKKKFKKTLPAKEGVVYRQVWRLVDGAIRETFAAHQDYLPNGKSEKRIRNSLSKRIVGKFMGYISQVPRGSSETDDRVAPDSVPATEM